MEARRSTGKVEATTEPTVIATEYDADGVTAWTEVFVVSPDWKQEQA